LRCRGCTSFASSKWTADEERLQRPVHPTVKGNLDVLKCSFKGLQHIKFIGGEPFLYEKEHESILRYLNENTDISRLSLEYATNATKRVSPEVLEIWRKVKYVQIGFSVDAYGARNDYFRHGSKWDEVMANVRWFRENVLPNWRQHFHFHTVVNIYNIHELAGFDDYLTGEFPGMSLSKDFLSEPLWLDICNLPNDEKELLAEYYEGQSQRADITRMRRDHYSYIVKRLKEPPAADFYQFVVEEMKVNKLWGYHLQEYHPRLAALVESTGL
jgi:sulfatase maturation enzyme AslB (radical SAM superfamily)